MKIGSVDVPCGCEERKEIMFTKGNVDRTLVLIIGIPIAVLLTMWVIK